jgi:hypothetical protein
MPLRYQKRINLGKGIGLNVSKSGVSTSYRNRQGTISTKGFSLRTGIPGLSFRQTWSKKSGPVGLILVMVIYGLIVIGWNVLRLAAYIIKQTSLFIVKRISHGK